MATLGKDVDLPIACGKLGIALSWDGGKAGGIDLDLQAVAFDTAGKLLDAVYYNNLKAFGRALVHSTDEVSGDKDGMDELIWADLAQLPENVGLIVFVLACHSGGHLRDAQNGKFHVLEDRKDNEVASFELEASEEEVDVVAALKRAVDNTGEGWNLCLIQEPARDGKHFIDVLEPTIGNYVRSVIPDAPRRIKACFAMEKAGVAVLPRTAEMGPLQAALGWDSKDESVDLDVSAVMLDGAGGHIDTVFFGNQEAPGVKHSGDNLTGEGKGDDEVIEVLLTALPENCAQIFFTINIYTAGQSFAQVANPYCRVITSEGDEFCRFMLAEAGDQQGLLMARLVKEPERWGFQALGMPSVGQTWKDSMPDVAKYAAMTPHGLQAVGP